jgi:pyruvate formate lyase activating enzyme
VEHLGPDVPWHFTAFHPDYRMNDRPRTPAASLTRARAIARGCGVRHVYTGNVYDPAGQSTYCHSCGELVIERDGYTLGRFRLDEAGRCAACGTRCPGVFESKPGSWGSRRLPVRLAEFRSAAQGGAQS